MFVPGLLGVKDRKFLELNETTMAPSKENSVFSQPRPYCVIRSHSLRELTLLPQKITHLGQKLNKNSWSSVTVTLVQT